MEYATRYLTLMLGAVQAYGIIKTIENTTEVEFPLMEALEANNAGWLAYLYIIVVMLAGTMLVMWLGDQISVKGIGNGISMIIFAGIVHVQEARDPRHAEGDRSGTGLQSRRVHPERGIPPVEDLFAEH